MRSLARRTAVAALGAAWTAALAAALTAAPADAQEPGEPSPAPEAAAPGAAAEPAAKAPPKPTVTAEMLRPGAGKFERYRGPHPLGADAAAGFCHIRRLHFHPDAPTAGEAQFVSRHGTHTFVGDPVAFGYDGEAYAHHSHHPLPGVQGFCFIDGPHWHHLRPRRGYELVKAGDLEVAFYVGPLPEDYHDQRKAASARGEWYRKADYKRPPAATPPGAWTKLWKGILAGKPVPKEAIGPPPGSALERLESLKLSGDRLKLALPPKVLGPGAKKGAAGKGGAGKGAGKGGPPGAGAHEEDE